MTLIKFEICPGCKARLPKSTGPTHRYIGASPGCWAIFTALFNGGQPPVDPAPINALLGDAYAAQHPGQPSAQAIQSVAIHLLTLYGVLVREVAPENALWVRRRALRDDKRGKRNRFEWLTPPSFSDTLTVAGIVQAPSATARAELVQRYVNEVWAAWAQSYAAIISTWYDESVLVD